jgi:hypothetical protein
MIRYQPKKLLSRIAPKKRVEKLVTQKLTLNRATLTTLSDTGVLTKKTLETIAIKVIRGYRDRYGDERDQGASKKEALDEALNNKKQLVKRVQNATVHEITQEVKRQFRGEFYVWLPSEAINPDPLHQLNYGKKFLLGKGEMPGDRYGCLCGMQILTDETKLEL